VSLILSFITILFYHLWKEITPRCYSHETSANKHNQKQKMITNYSHWEEAKTNKTVRLGQEEGLDSDKIVVFVFTECRPTCTAEEISDKDWAWYCIWSWLSTLLSICNLWLQRSASVAREEGVPNGVGWWRARQRLGSIHTWFRIRRVGVLSDAPSFYFQNNLK
jgi:hypothetical protein